MELTEVWVICLLGALETLHFLRFLQHACTTITNPTATTIWMIWIICTGLAGAVLTKEGLLAMADQNPEMKLGLPVVLAVYMAHFSIMHKYFTDSACVHICRFLDRAITFTWIVAQLEFRWGLCTVLMHFIACPSSCPIFQDPLVDS
ncbi:hypothetical protein F4808DRAFT_457404 [Astrocystis sublimbata]|nr:hypothetical protein F4808DRAFT_457404 [Astrocystis sublimbata]